MCHALSDDRQHEPSADRRHSARRSALSLMLMVRVGGSTGTPWSLATAQARPGPSSLVGQDFPWKRVEFNNTWQARTRLDVVALKDGKVLVTGGSIYMAGIQFSFNDVWWAFTGDAPGFKLAWKQDSNAPWPDDHRGSAAVALPNGTVLEMVCYRDSTALGLCGFWSSHNGGSSWGRVAAKPSWPARERFGAIALPNGTVLVMGGWRTEDDEKPSAWFNDIWSSTDGGLSWIKLAACTWQARIDFGLVALSNGTALVMGGFSEHHQYLNDIWSSDDGGQSWMPVVREATWRARSGLGAAVLYSGVVVVMGGYSGIGYFMDVWYSFDGGQSWADTAQQTTWSGRAHFGTVVLPHTSTVWIMGGEAAARSPGITNNDVFSVDFTIYAPLTPTSISSTPSPPTTPTSIPSTPSQNHAIFWFVLVCAVIFVVVVILVVVILVRQAKRRRPENNCDASNSFGDTAWAEPAAEWPVYAERADPQGEVPEEFLPGLLEERWAHQEDGLQTLRTLYLILRGGLGGAVIVLIREEYNRHVMFSKMDGGAFCRCFDEFGRNVHKDPRNVRALLNAFRRHTDTDRWELWLLQELSVELGFQDPPESLLALDGQPKDGALLVTFNGTVVGAVSRLRHSDGCSYTLTMPNGQGAGTRHAAALGTTAMMSGLWKQKPACALAPGAVLVASDAGGVSLMLPSREREEPQVWHVPAG